MGVRGATILGMAVSTVRLVALMSGFAAMAGAKPHILLFVSVLSRSAPHGLLLALGVLPRLLSTSTVALALLTWPHLQSPFSIQLPPGNVAREKEKEKETEIDRETERACI